MPPTTKPVRGSSSAGTGSTPSEAGSTFARSTTGFRFCGAEEAEGGSAQENRPRTRMTEAWNPAFMTLLPRGLPAALIP